MIMVWNVPAAVGHMKRLGLPDACLPPKIGEKKKKGRPKKKKCSRLCPSDRQLVAVYYGDQLVAHSLRAYRGGSTAFPSGEYFMLGNQPVPQIISAIQSAAKQHAAAAGLSADQVSLTFSNMPESTAVSLPHGQWGLKLAVAELQDHEAAIGAEVSGDVFLSDQLALPPC